MPSVYFPRNWSHFEWARGWACVFCRMPQHMRSRFSALLVNTQKSPPWACDKGCAEACAERFSALLLSSDIGWLRLTGANNHGGGGKPLVAFPGSTGNKLSSEVRRFGYVSRKLPTYPFPKPTLTLSSTREICFQSEPLFTKLQSIEFFRLVVTWSAYILEGGVGTWPKNTSSRHLKNTNKTEIKGKTD